MLHALLDGRTLFALFAALGLTHGFAHAQTTEFTNVTESVSISGDEEDDDLEPPLDEYSVRPGDSHGPGAVFADFSGDGLPDIYLVRAQGGGCSGAEDRWNVVYVNTGEGTFKPVTVCSAGLLADMADQGEATGAIAADYDNDGDVDIYVTNTGTAICSGVTNCGLPWNVLLSNHFAQTGRCEFTDVTDDTDPTPSNSSDVQSGVGNAWWDFEDTTTNDDDEPANNTLSAAWADVNRDGWLDLYVATHNGGGQCKLCEADENPKCCGLSSGDDGEVCGESLSFYYAAICAGFGPPNQSCPGVAPECEWTLDSAGPCSGDDDDFGQRDTLYLNNGPTGSSGDVTFTDVSEDLGIFGMPAASGDLGSSNAVIFADLNNDMWPDLIVSNKGDGNDQNMIYINQGIDPSGPTPNEWLGFEEIDCGTGCFSSSGADNTNAPMGIDVGDFDNDGDLDFYVTEAGNGENSLWRN